MIVMGEVSNFLPRFTLTFCVQKGNALTVLIWKADAVARIVRTRFALTLCARKTFALTFCIWRLMLHPEGKYPDTPRQDDICLNTLRPEGKCSNTPHPEGRCHSKNCPYNICLDTLCPVNIYLDILHLETHAASRRQMP